MSGIIRRHWPWRLRRSSASPGPAFWQPHNPGLGYQPAAPTAASFRQRVEAAIDTGDGFQATEISGQLTPFVRSVDTHQEARLPAARMRAECAAQRCYQNRAGRPGPIAFASA